MSNANLPIHILVLTHEMDIYLAYFPNTHQADIQKMDEYKNTRQIDLLKYNPYTLVS